MEEETVTVNSSELLELCSGLRAKDGDDDGLAEPSSTYRKGEDYFAKALLRTLRREQRAGGYSAMSQLVVWEIAKTDLVPMILAYRRDRKLCMTACKILVALTLPVTRAFQGVQEHLEKLQSLKELFVQGDVLAVLMSFLAEPLSKGTDYRTEKETSVVAVMLNLFHNLLHIRSLTTEASARMLDDALLRAFFREHIMQFFVILAQSVDKEANQPWAMLLSNTFFLISDGFVAEELSFAFHSRASVEGAKAQIAESASSLKALRSKEKRAAKEDRFRLSGRHSRFGGSLVTKDVDGSSKIVDARQLVAPVKLAPKAKLRQGSQVPWDRMDRDASPETKALLFEYFAQLVEKNVFALLMHETAQTIARADLEQAFVASFQADVNRYIRLFTWFIRFDYVRQLQSIRLSEDPRDVRREHPILETVPKDPKNQTFTLAHIETVLNPQMTTFLFQRAEHLFDQKPVSFRDLHYVFRALGEMMNTCGYILCNGTMDLKYEAKKTLYQIFLDRRQFLDRLPWLLQHVSLTKMPKHYLMSLVHLTDLTFILMEKIEEIDRGLVVLKKRQKHHGHSVRGGERRKGDEDEEEDASEDGVKLPPGEEEEEDFIVPDGADDGDEDYEDEDKKKKKLEAKRQRKKKRQEEKAAAEASRFNNFTELQTQEFALSDYIRKYQHNKVIEVCLRLLEEFDRNTEEVNMSVWRLFERIRTGSGDSLSALPAIFCQARVIVLFVRIFQHCRDVGDNAVRPSVRHLKAFATNIIEEIMRLTRDGMNAHIFASMLFWRTLRENQDFEDMNMRLAYEEARVLRAERGEAEPDFAAEANAWDKDDDAPGLQEDDILLDPEAIAESLRLDELRKAEQRRKMKPKKAASAQKIYVSQHLEELQDEFPDATRRSLTKQLRARYEALGDDEKEKYLRLEAEDLLRFEREMDLWEPEDGEEKEIVLKKMGGKKTKLSKRNRQLEENQAIVDQLAGDMDSNDEDSSGGNKRARQTDEGQSSRFSLQDDAEIRDGFNRLKGRANDELPRLLALHVNLERDATEKELVDRCRQLHLINAIQYEQMLRVAKKE